MDRSSEERLIQLHSQFDELFNQEERRREENHPALIPLGAVW